MVADAGLWVRLAFAVYTVLPVYAGCRGTYDVRRFVRHTSSIAISFVLKFN